MDHKELVYNEIKDRHIYFMDYFTGKLPKEDIQIFKEVIDEGFELITPSGDIFSHDDIVKMIENSHNTREEMKIWTENITSRKIEVDLIVATYNELQELAGKESNRISTALFRIVDGKAIWIHVHETWIK